jgi:hypothetical protein
MCSSLYASVLLLLASPALAVDYAEDVDGALSSTDATPTDLGVLDPGDNVISGAVSPVLKDSLTFRLPPGPALTGARLVVSSWDDPSGTDTAWAHLRDTFLPVPLAYSSDVVVDGPGAYTFTDDLPLDVPDDVLVTISTTGFEASFDWQLVLTVGSSALYDETRDGDLPARVQPGTAQDLPSGDVVVSGAATAADDDVFTFHVPVGFEVVSSSLRVDAFAGTAGYARVFDDARVNRGALDVEVAFVGEGTDDLGAIPAARDLSFQVGGADFEWQVAFSVQPVPVTRPTLPLTMQAVPGPLGIDVYGLTPGAPVIVVASVAEGTDDLGVTRCASTPTGLASPSRFGVATADADGRATVWRTVPSWAAGLEAYLVAVDGATCATSDLLTLRL